MPTLNTDNSRVDVTNGFRLSATTESDVCYDLRVGLMSNVFVHVFRPLTAEIFQELGFSFAVLLHPGKIFYHLPNIHVTEFQLFILASDNLEDNNNINF